MGIPVLILGESGTGKSASMRNFQEGEVGIINVARKPLPFRSKIKTFNSDDYAKIEGVIKVMKSPSAVIDDAQYLLVNEFMRRTAERGFDKFSDMAYKYWHLVQTIIDLPEDKIVYMMSHIDRDSYGNEKCKTIGKVLDDKITVEGMFTIVLKTKVTDGKYSFITQNQGNDTVKSPIGLFESAEIDNDLKMVDNAIRAYYNI